MVSIVPIINGEIGHGRKRWSVPMEKGERYKRKVLLGDCNGEAMTSRAASKSNVSHILIMIFKN
jgi:hypothetical protein